MGIRGTQLAGRAEPLPDAKSQAFLERGRLLWVALAGGCVLLFGFPWLDRVAVVSDSLGLEFPSQSMHCLCGECSSGRSRRVRCQCGFVSRKSF